MNLADLQATQNAAVNEEDRRKSYQPRINEELRGDVENFSQRVVTAAKPDLFIPLPNRNRTSVHNCEINLATLQRMNIHAIQRDLVHLASEIIRNDQMEMYPGPFGQVTRMRELMKEYCKYLYIFMTVSSLQCLVDLNS